MQSPSSALFSTRFAQHYQPIVNLQTLDLEGYESLLRPIGFSEDTFALVRRFEKTGQIRELDLWSLDQAINNLSILERSPRVAVNLSAKSFCDPLFAEDVDFLLSQKRGAKIDFEVTESEPIVDIYAALGFIEMAHYHGCRVGMDDFGSGHAHLHVVEHLGLDFIKLSSRLTTVMEHNQSARRLIEKAVGFALTRDMSVVGEHIERPGQYSAIRDIGVHYGQGWLFAAAGKELLPARNFLPELEKAQRAQKDQRKMKLVADPPLSFAY